MAKDIEELYKSSDALGLADYIRRGEVTAGEIMEAAIAQAESLNPRINALVSWDYEQALTASRGCPSDSLFRGVPYLEKNHAVEVAGFRTTNGSKFLHRLAPKSKEDSESVRRLRLAGLIPFGMTNSPEMGLHWTTEPSAYGATLNPWDLTVSAGGSSGGAAAAVSARIVPIAGGSDGAGSIRVPASACGLVGLKPSRGRIPWPTNGGALPVAVLGCLTRTVRDTAAYLDAAGGPSPGDYFVTTAPDKPFVDLAAQPPTQQRIGLVTSMPSGFKIDPEIVHWLSETARLLEGEGHIIEPCEIHLNTEEWRLARYRISDLLLAQQVKEWEQTLGGRILDDDIEPLTRSLIDGSSQVDAMTFARDVGRIGELTRAMATKLARYDLVLCPVYPVRTLRVGEGDYQAWPAELAMAFGEYLGPINGCGVPAISLPVATFRDGLPLGVQLIARFGEEATLLQVANALEQQLRWHERRPSIVG